MASSYSFDIVSQVDMQEVDNAVNQSLKEISQRYDFKGSKTSIELLKDEIKIHSEDEYKLKTVIEILKAKFVKRGVSPKAIDIGKIDNASLGTVKVTANIINGISKEKAKEIQSSIKESKIKVQTQVMEDQLRVTGKNKDDLQEVIGLVKQKDFGIAVQFVNFR
ncbi:YajQ family cyclic di-GMP-binding protein [Clostridium sp. 'White wine YQ']|uniref:YajQ family cyclic di-GMP-binding protein n=1 Tax=Clostridium sp. 'White wine YQ' TaxID=3027474 RepID=UPI00236541E8|nr:YajQ family cyclic di-GMP-binding protein [Clostridium sp. 'White wine YQ']MDD7794963.1 YajQ family cyclic di-GMP-binding protein [Clostridium sp. 'White wine YQ']